jgi:hypothetical protein
MKVYVALDALPWESFKIEATGADGQKGTVQAKSSASMAGYLPVFWSEAAAKAALPHASVQELDIADDWHPMINALRSASLTATESAVAEISE